MRNRPGHPQPAPRTSSSSSSSSSFSSRTIRKCFTSTPFLLFFMMGAYMSMMILVFSQHPGGPSMTEHSLILDHPKSSSQKKKGLWRQAALSARNATTAKRPVPNNFPPRRREGSTPAHPTEGDTIDKKKADSNHVQSTSSSIVHQKTTSVSSAPPVLPTPEEHQQVREYLMKTMKRVFLPLMAVLEPQIVYDTSNKPLPLRDPINLTTISYPNHLQSCHHLHNQWPVFHTEDLDSKYGPNVGMLKSLYNVRHQYANEVCPVDADPFLPWIHDIFTSADGQFVEIIAHQKRRCNSDPTYFSADIANLEPQVTLLQSVPIQRLSEAQWKNMSFMSPQINALRWKDTPLLPREHRYRLVPLEEADANSTETRFLCQFHTLRPTQSGEDGVEKIVVGETWSVYPYNYEFANFRHRRGQGANPMLTRPRHSSDTVGLHNEQVWNAISLARCPIPRVLQPELDREIPSYYLDLVPVRTPPRLTVTGYAPQILELSEFDPHLEWGSTHILPPVSRSGRWANIPLCPPPVTLETKKEDQSSPMSIAMAQTNNSPTNVTSQKPNFMVGCIWASAVFSERSSSNWDTHTQSRMIEWLAYHLELAGFDHIVVYDNTEAHTNQTSLQSVVDLFPASKVTRVPWKHRVCSNNGSGKSNPGERSSQYAAEASCRLRYGPTTEWMAFFDTDEYLIPSGNWTSIREWLREGVKDGSIGADTNILSFYETKARLNHRFTEPYYDETYYCHKDCRSCNCLIKQANATFLESYCEPFPFPRKFPDSKAKMKQIYRPDFVLNHFVHYATATRLLFDKPRHPRVVGWPFERRAKEFTEAYMLHTKTRSPSSTRSWNTMSCSRPTTCTIGFPWPHYQGENTTAEEDIGLNEYGFPYNCYELRQVKDNLAEKLRAIVQPLLQRWTPPVLRKR